MHVDRLGDKVLEIAVLWCDLRDNLTLKTIDKEEKAALQKRIENIVALYDSAVEQKAKYVPDVRGEINSILYTLKRLQERNDIIISNAFKKYSHFLKNR